MASSISSGIGCSVTPPLLTPVIISKFGSYLGEDASVFASVKVCKAWKTHFQERLQHVYEDEYCRRIGYLPKYVEAFRSRNLSLWRLPVLDSSQLSQTEDRVYLPDATEKEMTSPVARFTLGDGRVGFVLKFRGYREGDFANLGSRKNPRPIRSVSGTFVIFVKNHPNEWAFSTTDIVNIFDLIGIYANLTILDEHGHDVFNSCSRCSPILRGWYTKDFGIRKHIPMWISELVTEKDLAVKIDGQIEQVKTPVPLPEMMPPPIRSPFYSFGCFEPILLFLSWLIEQICHQLSEDRFNE